MRTSDTFGEIRSRLEADRVDFPALIEHMTEAINEDEAHYTEVVLPYVLDKLEALDFNPRIGDGISPNLLTFPVLTKDMAHKLVKCHTYAATAEFTSPSRHQYQHNHHKDMRIVESMEEAIRVITTLINESVHFDPNWPRRFEAKKNMVDNRMTLEINLTFGTLWPGLGQGHGKLIIVPGPLRKYAGCDMEEESHWARGEMVRLGYTP